MTNVNEDALTNTQQRIIDAALDLVSHVGYKSTTTKMIAQKAEVNETTIFKNFQSKQVLLDTAFKQHTKQITKEVGNEQTKTIFNYKQEYIQHLLCTKLKEFSTDHSLNDQQYETIVFIFNSAIMSLLVDKARKEYSDDEEGMTIHLDDVIDLMLKTFTWFLVDNLETK